MTLTQKKRTLGTGEMAQWLKEHFLLISKTQVENLSTLVKRQLSVITASEYLILWLLRIPVLTHIHVQTLTSLHN